MAGNASGGGSSQKRSVSCIEASDRINVVRYKVRCLSSMLSDMAGCAESRNEDSFLNGMAFFLDDIDDALASAEGLL